MSDVAALAGVSHQTVSRVLNDHPSVRPGTRARVLDAVEALGYRRNSAARTLVTRRSGTIGVVTSGSALFGPISTLLAIERAARDGGLFVSVVTVRQWDAAEVRTALDHFMDQGVDGAVVIANQDDALDAVRTWDARIPVVVVGSQDVPSGRLRAVAVDQYAGACTAVWHLLDLGHRSIAHLTGPMDWIDARERLRGWRDELEWAGRAVPAPIDGDWTAERGFRVGLALADGELPTAVFAANDQLALGLLHAFAQRGVRVPQDVSVVGFDAVDGSDHFVPPLTTVHQDFEGLGQRCLAVLRTAIDGEAASAETIVPRLIVRASTAAPRTPEA
ncbi:LacI family DNA-binding transcriptional regulator [Actinotalea sp.]|uniref:LacI family DNA-binding transcriptional regulator n=1 Tax=Actinotalea sp. TaxID=1872145 RepID=UPI0035624BC6